MKINKNALTGTQLCLLNQIKQFKIKIKFLF